MRSPRGRSRRTRVLVNDALLPLVEALAGLVRPPLLQLALLVVKSAGRIKRVLQRMSQRFRSDESNPKQMLTVSSCAATWPNDP